MIKTLERAIDWYEVKLDSIFSGSWQLFSMAAILIVFIGHLGSCVSSRGSQKQSPAEVVELDESIESHKILSVAFAKVHAATSDEDTSMVVVKSTDINAASMGSGRYILWEGLATLPPWAIEAILAHEVSHDRLMHSQKAHDLNDFTQFWTELIGTVGGADFATSETLNGWGTNLVIPIYNKGQELEADAGAIDVLRLMGDKHPAETYANALELLLKAYGDIGGKFSDSHPATSERIRLVRLNKT